MSDRERVAKKLHELFGTALYGHDIGPWESDRVQDERSRWLAHADALLASDALAQMLAEARAEALREAADTLWRIFLRLPHTPSPLGDYVQRKSQEFRRAALTAAEPDAGERDA